MKKGMILLVALLLSILVSGSTLPLFSRPAVAGSGCGSC